MPTTPPITYGKGLFSARDLMVNGLAPGVSQGDVIAALGEADREQSGVDDLTKQNWITLDYGTNQLTFTQGKLTGVDLHDVALIGPRGIRVGDTLSMLEKAYGLSGAGAPYYAQANNLPPRAEKVALLGDGSYSILLTAPVAPYTQDELSGPLAYMGAEHAQLIYTLSTDTNRITAIQWIVAPLSETGD
jgi:hypothetical protein